MSFKNYLKEEAGKERQKLSQMSGRDKVWYIWEYYKLPIIGAVIVVFLIASFAHAFYSNRFDNALYIMILNDKSGGDNHTDEMADALGEYLNLGKNERVVIDDSLSATYGDSTTEMGYASLAKITALITTKDLDVIISDKASMDHFGSLNAYSNLEEELPADLYALVKDHLYYADNSDGVSYPCAIRLDESRFPEESGAILKPPYLAILTNSQHKEACFALIRYLFEQA